MVTCKQFGWGEGKWYYGAGLDEYNLRGTGKSNADDQGLPTKSLLTPGPIQPNRAIYSENSRQHRRSMRIGTGCDLA
jgi:hypothetical protein